MVREYKDSGIEWIGRIPKGWRVNKVNRLFGIIGSGTTPNSSDDDAFVGDINWLQSGDINGSIITNACKKISNDTLAKYSVLFIYKAPFIIVAMYGASVGNISISHIDACVNQACCVLSDSKIDFTYAFYAIKSAQRYLIFRAVGGGQPNISQYTLRQLWIPEPPLAEQRAIASYLDKKCAEIDSLIELQEQMIAQLTDYKQSVITEAVTKGLNPEAELVSSGIDWIGDVPKGWKVKKVKYIVDTLSKGNGISKEEVFSDGDTPCVRYGEIYSKYNHSFKNCVSSTNIAIQKSPHYFNHGDILCAGTGELVEEIGKSIVYLGEDSCLAGGDIIVITHRQNPSFLNYALNSNYAQAQKSRGKAKLKVVHISAFEIGSIYLLLPPLAEQQSIASYLDAKCHEIDTLISIKQQKIETLKEYKKSIIFEAVTGKAY